MEHFTSLIKKIKKKEVLLIGDTVLIRIYTNTLGKPAKESILSVLRKDENFRSAVAAANNISDFSRTLYS